MRLLPPLIADGTRWVLPMADRSAALLFHALLIDDPHAAAASRLEALGADPALAIWVVILAALRDGVRLQSLAQAEEWLGQHALEVLRWDPQRDRFSPGPESAGLSQYGELAGIGLALADLAALRAADRGPKAAEQARLAGLVYHAPKWLALSPLPRAKREAAVPREFLAATAERAGADVIEALELLEGRREPESGRFDPAACRRRVEEPHRQWVAQRGEPAEPLPQLVERLARLQELESRFQQAVERGKLEAMAEFAAGAGHEINNPLAIIAGRAQLLLRDEADCERRRELALINAQVKRAHEMIADMRLFARPPRPEPSRFDLVALVDAVMAELGPQAAERATTLVRSGDAGPLEIEADPAQLSVAMHALCRNAWEALGHGGRIDVVVEGGLRTVRIRVTDNGPGISSEHLPHLFDPFFSARQAGRGLGLGLSKCWRIVTGHGGQIHVETQPARGTTFTIELPRQQPSHES